MNLSSRIVLLDEFLKAIKKTEFRNEKFFLSDFFCKVDDCYFCIQTQNDVNNVLFFFKKSFFKRKAKNVKKTICNFLLFAHENKFNYLKIVGRYNFFLKYFDCENFIKDGKKENEQDVFYVRYTEKGIEKLKKILESL